jgi:DNA repair protein RAD1
LSIGGSSRDFSKSETQPIIVVDSREFNASLPSALFKAGFQLIPITLNVCDYVLSADTGIERKAFQDLVSSLSSGRLQKQMEQMSRLYRVPLLLIEMDDGEHGMFKLTGEATITTSRLIVLLRSYPQMRIIWSFSDRSSCRVGINGVDDV